jgi:regulator of nucleoside diphosphate kinase
MREYPIIVTAQDLSRLRGLFGGMSRASILDRGHLSQLQDELDRALVLPADEVPVGVVTIDSRVRVVDLDTGKRSVLTLVLPDDADIAERRISVLAPIGSALLGFRASDEVEWTMPGGRRRLHIEHVIQPNQIVATRRTRYAQPVRHGAMEAR